MSEDAASAVSEATEAPASTAEPVATEAASPTTSQSESTQPDQESIDRAFFAKNPADGSKPEETASSETEATEGDAEQAPPATETPKVEGYEGITKPQVDALKRFKVSPAAWGKLDAAERTELLGSVDEHVRYTSRLAQENAAFKKQQPNQANPAETTEAPAAATPAANAQQYPPPVQTDGQHWSQFKEYGDDFVKGLQGTFQAELSPVVQLQQQLQQELNAVRTLMQDFGERMYEDDTDAAFEDVVLPDGVDKSNPEIRKAILTRALEQFGPDLSGFSFKGRSLRGAIHTAATTLFQKQAQQAAQAQQKTRVQSHLRASPTRTTAAATTTKAPISQEEVDRIALAAIGRGGRESDVRKEIEKAGRQ